MGDYDIDYDEYEEGYDDEYEYQEDVVEDYDDGVWEEDTGSGIPIPHALVIFLVAAFLGLVVTIKPIEDLKTYFYVVAAPYLEILPLPQGGGGEQVQLRGSAIFGKQTVVNAKISWYWPDLGGTNCAKFVNGHCVSTTASGDPWQWWVDKGCACPKQFPFGTQFVIDGRIWTCVDRGGKIAFLPDGTFWLDLLTSAPLYPYGTIVPVTVIYPLGGS